MIVLRDLTKAYDGRMVIEHFSAELQEGGKYLITAPSGAGKTTLLRLILGLEKPDAGEVDFQGQEPRFGVCFQEDRLFPSFSAVQNVVSVHSFLKGADGEARARSMLAEILPAEELSKSVSELSGGMKRRVSLVRAMMSDGNILILDEPFTGLDDETRRRAIHFLEKHRGDRTLILTSHVTDGLSDFEILSL